MGARTGADYIAALRDGRSVWHAGQRIEDVPSHPGFSGTVQTLARLYDRQHVSPDREIMTYAADGTRYSLSYLPPTSPEELAAKRRNTELWSSATLGQMGRFPDFCAELATGLLDAADALGEADPRFGANARAYYRHCAERDLCLTHALNDQFYDRSKRVAEQPDPSQMLHVVRETSDGPIVRGLRNLATLAPLSDESLVYPIVPRQPDEADYALAFAIPMNAPGLTTICRDLYGEHARPERLPLSARFDEVDATLLFDDVLVPWERVFVYRNAALAATFHRRLNLWAGYTTVIRLLTRLETLFGVVDLLGEWAGRTNDRGAPIRLGQLIQDLEVLSACLQAAEANGYYTPAGYYVPRLSDAYRLHSIDAADRALRLLQDLLTSALVLTGGESDLDSPLGAHVERWFRAAAPSTREHLRLLAVAADLVQSAFAIRNQLYERYQSGDPDATRQRLYRGYDRARLHAPVLRFIREQWDVGSTAP